MSEKNKPKILDYQSHLDNDFINIRSKILDIAAFVDRLERTSKPNEIDYREKVLFECLLLIIKQPKSSPKAILSLLSYHDMTPIEESSFQGAYGAPSQIHNENSRK